mgnify:CR=1 FL=1
MLSLPRQSDEPALLSIFVSDAWQLHRCDCGHSFGSNGSNSAVCTMCGSPNSVVISLFPNSRQLADAVSKANLPKEISRDISKRLKSLEKKPANMDSIDSTIRSKTIQAMRESTDDAGIMTIESLNSTLTKKGISGISPEHLIGQAELEGMLIRIDNESWSWLQQSS